MKLLPLCFLLLKSALVIASDVQESAYPSQDTAKSAYPFHDAATRGDWLSLQRLLNEENLDQPRPEEADPYGNTALHIAAAKGDLPCLELLTDMISSDVIYQLNQKEQTPLDLAILSGKPSVLAFFLDHGADPDETTTIIKDLLLSSVTYAQPKALKRILSSMKMEEHPITIPDLAGFQTQLLHTAIRSGNPETITLILQSGMKPDQTEGDDWGFLHVAASYNQPEILTALIKGLPGTDINQKDPNGITPLHVAAFKGHTENVRCLLAAGAKPDLTDNSGQTALQIAAQNGKLETVQAITDARKKEERRLLQLQEAQTRRLTIDKPESQEEDTDNERIRDKRPDEDIDDERMREKIPDRTEELCLCPCLLM